jgi:hypothetical protein
MVYNASIGDDKMADNTEETLVDIKIERAILQEKLARVKKILKHAVDNTGQWGVQASYFAEYILTTTFDAEEK